MYVRCPFGYILGMSPIGTVGILQFYFQVDVYLHSVNKMLLDCKHLYILLSSNCILDLQYIL